MSKIETTGDRWGLTQIPAMTGMTPLGFRKPDRLTVSYGSTPVGTVAGPSGSLGLHNELGRDQATLAQRKANAPLLARVAQAPCDVGLFSDDSAQSDLIERVRR